MRALLPALFAFSLLSAPAAAQITNGDFSNGMTGWTTASSPPVTVYQYLAFGLPTPSALFSAPISSPLGFASTSQTFQCGSGAEAGTCVIAFDYYVDVSSATVKIEAIVDGTTEYTLTRNTDTGGWVHAVVNVECGERALTVKVTCTSAGPFANWQVYVDNVTGACEVPVPTEASTWGKIKALYR